MDVSNSSVNKCPREPSYCLKILSILEGLDCKEDYNAVSPGVTTLSKKTIYVHFLMNLKFINPTTIYVHFLMNLKFINSTTIYLQIYSAKENGLIFKIGSTTSF